VGVDFTPIPDVYAVDGGFESVGRRSVRQFRQFRATIRVAGEETAGKRQV
jgi:hypothetical protein